MTGEIISRVPAPAPLRTPIPADDDGPIEVTGGVTYGLRTSEVAAEIKERTGLAEDALAHEMMVLSCAFFASEVLTGPGEQPYNGRFLVAEHHEEWSELLNSHDRLCIEAPRDHGKTFFFDFAYPIWQAWKQPGGAGYIFSATQPQAERILDAIKLELENNPRLQHLIPKRKDKWSGSAIRLANGHTIHARGFGTKVRGAHPRWIVVDDGLNDETAYSETVRRKQLDYFYNAISNMIIPGGQIIVVGTPFHMSDLYANLEKNEEYFFRRYQAVSKDGLPLWPERYSADRLERKKREIGSIRFTREFQCLAMADDMSLFPRSFFMGEPVEQYKITLGMPVSFWDQMGVTTRFMGVDFAISANVEADYTVVWVMGVDRYGNRWIIDFAREKGLPYEAQKSLIFKMGKQYEVALIFTESNQMQRLFGDELIRTTDLPIKQYQTGVEKHSLEKGIPSLRILLENKKVRIPRGDQRSIELTDVWIDEMHNHTFQDGEVLCIGEHDDTAMAFWICDQACRQGAFGFSFGEEEGDAEAYDAAAEELEADPYSEPEVDPDDQDLLILRPERLEKRGGIHNKLISKEDQESLSRARWKPKEGAPLAGLIGLYRSR